jgi:phosphotransferase system HPr (HPr) family protein
MNPISHPEAHRPAPMFHHRRRIVITGEGLHLRPLALFAKEAMGFAGDVRVRHGEAAADGKSIMEMMFLCAEAGASVEVEVQGAGGEAALHRLIRVLVQDGVAAAEGDFCPAGGAGEDPACRQTA